MDSTIEMYKDSANEWRWRIRSPNGNIVATSGEGYKNRSHCEDMINGMWDRFANADIEVLDDGGE